MADGALNIVTQRITADEAALKSKPDVLFGTVETVSGAMLYVVLDGDETATPCARECSASAGDRVTVIRRGVHAVAVSRLGGDGGAAENGLPTGGTEGQVLTKASSADYAAEWADATGGGQTAWYGTCTTADTVAAKVVTCAGFELTTGALIAVKFSNAYTNASGGMTLNVNGTGAKPIWSRGAVTGYANNIVWYQNSTVLFSYDGTHWNYITSDAGPVVASKSRPTSANLARGNGTAALTHIIAKSGTMSTGMPMSEGHIIDMDWDAGYANRAQLFLPHTTGFPQWRGQKGGANSWGAWDTFYTVANPPALDALSGTLPVANGGTGQTGVSSAETTVANVIDAGTGVTISNVTYRTWGKMAQVLVGFRVSSALADNATVVVGTLVSGKRPVMASQCGYISNDGYISTTGEIAVRNITGSSIGTTTTIYTAASYLLA